MLTKRTLSFQVTCFIGDVGIDSKEGLAGFVNSILKSSYNMY